ncbi:MAG: glutamine amidotransferase [bacterium]|nr:glutamine amidotransferase [bacterium]
MELTIGWLYPKQMSTYGDRGNILTLVKRSQWRKIKTKVKEINLGDDLEPNQVDLYFFGGGQDQAQIEVSKDLKKSKEGFLRSDLEKRKVFFSICGGYQLLSKFYRTADGVELEGLGFLDAFTLAGEKRMIGNIAVEVNPKLLHGTLVGFENHSGKTYLEKGTEPLGKVLIGSGNNGEDRLEGAWKNNTFGCYLHGPVLPKNPRFADLLLERALQGRYGSVELAPLDDSVETSTHDSAFQRTKQVSKL